MAERQTIRSLVEQLETGDEFTVHAGEFIVDEIVDCDARPMVRVRKKSVGGYMERTYRLEWADPTDEDDETLVIKTKYKSHWSEWSTFAPEKVELEEEPVEIDTETEESEPVLVTDGGVETSSNDPELMDLIKEAEKYLAVMKGNGLGSPYHVVDTTTFDNHLKTPADYEGHGASIGQANSLCGHDLFGRMLPESVTTHNHICGNCLRSLKTGTKREMSGSSTDEDR